VIPRLRAICCSGSTSSFSWPEERRRVFRVRAGDRAVDEVRLLWVFGFDGFVVVTLVGLSSMRESSSFAESSTNCNAIL